MHWLAQYMHICMLKLLSPSPFYWTKIKVTLCLKHIWVNIPFPHQLWIFSIHRYSDTVMVWLNSWLTTIYADDTIFLFIDLQYNMFHIVIGAFSAVPLLLDHKKNRKIRALVHSILANLMSCTSYKINIGCLPLARLHILFYDSLLMFSCSTFPINSTVVYEMCILLCLCYKICNWN